MESLGRALRERRGAHLLEIGAVAAVGVIVIAIGWSVVGSDPLRRQAVAWIGNVAMLLAIWLDLRLRGQTWEQLGLRRRFAGGRAVLRTLLQSVAVFVAALVAFLLGSMVILNLTSTTASANMSGYGYLEGNLPMLLLALALVFIVSSFGEEVTYRGFLITRLTEAGGNTKAASWMAVGASAVVFGGIHFTWGVMGIVQTAFMGLALGVSYLIVKRNLWVLVLAHAYMDSILLLQMYLGAAGTTGN